MEDYNRFGINIQEGKQNKNFLVYDGVSCTNNTSLQQEVANLNITKQKFCLKALESYQGWQALKSQASRKKEYTQK